MNKTQIKELHNMLITQWNKLDAIVNVLEDGSTAKRIATEQLTEKEAIMNILQKFLPKNN